MNCKLRSDFHLEDLISDVDKGLSSEENTLLNEFNDEELLDVIKKPDEWAVEDIVMAQTLLEKRGNIVKSLFAGCLREARVHIRPFVMLSACRVFKRGFCVCGPSAA